MKTKRKSVIWLIFTVPIVAVLIIYLILTIYYEDKFIAGTWINGQYCTGLGIEEVNSLLIEDTELPTVTIRDADGNVEYISFTEEIVTYDYEMQLQTILGQQDNFSWFLRILSGLNQQILPDITYDSEGLWEEINKLNIVKNSRNVEKARADIIKTDSGYVLEHNLVPVPDEKKITEKILSDIEAGEENIVLTDECYFDRPVTVAITETLSLWEKVEGIQDCGIVYDMGDTMIPVDASVVSEWIAVDEAGNIMTDDNGEIVLVEDCFETFIDGLSEEFDTYNVPREFKATRGDVVTIEKGNYGNCLDKNAEIAYLQKAFEEGVCEIHTPAYTQEALYKGKDDIGNTYIEIDLTAQTMYYYEEGELVVETPIVSGNISSGHKTPERVCYVYNKQENRILRGPGYAQHVDYWIPILGAIGIHDCAWRKQFGGDIYKTNGSHGCINTPDDAVSVLYERVEIGTPVIMYY